MELINREILRARLVAAGRTERLINEECDNGTSVSIEQSSPLQTIRYIGEETLLGVKNLVHQVRAAGCLQYRMNNSAAISCNWTWTSADDCDVARSRSLPGGWLPEPLNALWKLVFGMFLIIEALWIWTSALLPLEAFKDVHGTVPAKYISMAIAALFAGTKLDALQLSGQTVLPLNEFATLFPILLIAVHPAILTVLHASFNGRLRGFQKLSWLIATLICSPLAVSAYIATQLRFCNRATRTLGILAVVACEVPFLTLKCWQLYAINHNEAAALLTPGTSQFVAEMLCDLSVHFLCPCLFLAFIVHTARFGWQKLRDEI